MRISSGIAKGRKVKTGSVHSHVRPTMALVREALFNILQQKIVGAVFLDLYAGTGAVGCEALSRGAVEVVFVEENKTYAKGINQLVRTLGFSDRAKIITKKATSFLKDAELTDVTFDIMFLDPPYHTDEIDYALSAIGKSHLLKSGGLVIAEHFIKRKILHSIGNLTLLRDYIYGDTVLSVYSTKTLAEETSRVYGSQRKMEIAEASRLGCQARCLTYFQTKEVNDE